MFSVNGKPVTISRFPDGTPHLKIDVDSRYVNIEWLYEQDEEMLLLFITKHLREKYEPNDIKLTMPYIPHARMDRVKHNNEVFTLKYFCDFVNSLNFDSVIVNDAHSNVALALLNNVIHCNMQPLIQHVIKRVAPDILFFPDEGSCKRYSELVKFPYAFGIKKRDWNTGKILGLDIYGNVPSSPFDVLIIDDICCFGTTFVKSAGKLRELGANKIFLYVTHAENNILKGDVTKCGLFHRIYTTKSIFTEQHDMIEVIGG